MVWGNVSAIRVAPRSDAVVDAASWCLSPSGFRADTPRTFQLAGRSASRDRVAIKSTSSSLNPLRHPGTMSSSVVPGCADRTAQSASSSDRDAAREGTGMPSPSLWVGACDVENPSAPSSRERASTDSMAWTWSAEATVPTASSPITERRTAEWPTRKPAFTPTEPSSRPSHSPKEVQDQSRHSRAARGMPSTRAIMRARYRECSGPAGASENPQLPPITVVTPCSGEGLAVGSHDSCAS